MSYQPIDLVILSKKIDALQIAVSTTLASLATLTPIVKRDVIDYMQKKAKNSKDPITKKVIFELIDKISSELTPS